MMFIPRKRVAVLAVLVVLALVTLAFFNWPLGLTTLSHFSLSLTPDIRAPSLSGAHSLHDKPSTYNSQGAIHSKLTKDGTLASTQNRKRKRVVYSCSGGCGGWADRQKGIVSAYVLAAMLNRDFGVYITFPCDLSQFLEEGRARWKVAPYQLAVPSSRIYKQLDRLAVDFTKDFLTEKNLERRFPEDISVFTWNMEVVQFLKQHQMASRLGWLRAPVPEVYRQALENLFVLKPPLQRALDDLKNALPNGTQLVCAQVRLGKHNGTFPDVEPWHTFEQFPILVNFLKRYNDSGRYRIFFASDSVEILHRARARFPGVYLDIPGPITHTDKSRGSDACEGFKKAILDEYALSLCDVLVISESGIGKIASFMRGTDSRLYLFHDVKIDPFTRTGRFPNKSGW